MHAVSQLDHQLYHFQHHLSLHNYNQNITSSHHHPLFSSSNANISTPQSPPQIPSYHHSSLCMSHSVPSRFLVRTSAFQHQIQPAMIRSLACNDPFLSMQGSVPYHARSRSLSCRFRFPHVRFCSLACKVLFLIVQGSVPCRARFCSIMSRSVPLQVIIRSIPLIIQTTMQRSEPAHVRIHQVTSHHLLTHRIISSHHIALIGS